MMVPLVSICIPTYNRYDKLQNTIESITKTNEFINGEVEIVVSDNCSTDETEKVCKKYVAVSENFIYRRNEVNIRDANFFHVIKIANGKLRKLWNDTMLAKEGAMRVLCKICRDYYQQKKFLVCLNDEKLKKEEILHLKNADELLMTAGHNLTWTGMLAVWDYDVPKLNGEGTELCLWQTVQMMSFAAKTNYIICAKFAMTTVDVVKPKNMKYGIFQVFYHNFIESILGKYAQLGLIREDTISQIKKIILYKFFMELTIQWYRWLLEEGDIIFDDKENLPRLIEREYGKEYYFDDYKALLKIRLAKEFSPYLFYKYEKIKYKVKKMMDGCGLNN